jgi:hypothetical protein
MVSGVERVGSLFRIRKPYLSWKALRATLGADVVTLRSYGGTNARQKFELFSSPHHEFPFVPRRSLGVALINLKQSEYDYRRHILKPLAKRKLKQASRLQYVYGRIDSAAAIDAIMEINRSLPVRQGVAMDDYYQSEEEFAPLVREHEQVHVVMDSSGCIVAYALVLNIGDVWVIEHVLGHGAHLKNGIMYLLMSKMIEEKLALANVAGNPGWIMYDSILGSSDGLRQFKAVLGFTPYWVRWRWADRS